MRHQVTLPLLEPPAGPGGAYDQAMAGQGSTASSAASGQGQRYLQVQTTTDSRAEAMELARAAVEARLAACAQVAGPVASTYWWEDAIERAEEWLLLLKLPAAGYQELANFITERHSYDEPEIVATPIVAGSESYLSWIAEETRAEETRAQ
jgi:periplasmic divalent cation tolerance protein